MPCRGARVGRRRLFPVACSLFFAFEQTNDTYVHVWLGKTSFFTMDGTCHAAFTATEVRVPRG